VVWTALSLLWTKSAESSFAELARVIGFAGVLAFVWLGVTRETWRAAAAGLGAAALSVALAAVLSRLAPDLFGDSVGVSVEGRLAYPLGYWNAVGVWGAAACGLGLGWSLGARHPHTRALALALVPVAGVAVYLSYSRGGVLATVLGVAVVIGLARDRRRAVLHALAAAAGCGLAIAAVRASPEIADATGGGGGGLVAGVLVLCGAGCAALAARGLRSAPGGPPGRRALLVAAGTLVAAVVIAAAVIGPRAVSGADEALTVGDYPATSGDPAARLVSGSDARPRIWGEALEAAWAEPLTGIGPGTFDLWWSEEVGQPVLRDAHSVFLEALAELGVVGLVATIALFAALGLGAVGAAVGAERSTDAAVVAGLVAAFAAFAAGATIDWLWEVPAVGLLALAAAAVATVAGGPPRRRRRLGPRRFALVGLAVIAGAVQVPGVVSTELVRESAILLDHGDIDEAAEYAADASAAEPWAADPYAQRAYVAEVAGEFEQAADYADEAIERDPDDWRHHALLARIELGRDDRVAALAALREAVRLRAGDPDAIGTEALIVLGTP
jgi:hypothetical protein